MCALCQQLGIDLHKLNAGGFDGAADGASASWAALPGGSGADAESSGSDTVPGSTGTSSTLSGASSVRGFINAGGDQDWYAVTLTAGQTYTFALSGFGIGALSDAYLRLLDASGVQVAFDDDSGPLANSKLTLTASASGTYYVSAQGYGTTTGQYLLTMATGTTPYAPVVSVSDIADYLTNSYWEVNGSIAHHWGVSTISYNLTGLSAARADLARAAFQLWSEVANLTFVETTGTGQITLDDTQSGAFSSSNYGSNGIITSATVNVDPTWYGSSSAIDSYTLQTFIHEIGHALGLGHAGPYNGSATYGVDNSYANDTWQYTLMSYMAESNFGGVSYRFTMTPMMADILAIQNLYGAATTRAGDTVYGFGSTAGSMYDFSSYSQAPALTIYDSGGTDTLNASGYSQNQVINLTGGSFSNIGGLVGNIGIYTTAVIENAVGGSGNDTITGNSVANVLTGGGGADTLNGLAGDDTLVGGTGNDTMAGGTGNDTYYVDSLSDVVTENGGEGTDTVYVTVNGYTLASNVEIGRIALTTGSTLTGNALDNALYGNSGADTLDGGTGTDTVVYSGLASNYQLVHNANGTWTITDLRTGSPDGTDTLINIEQIQFSDTLVSLNTVLSTPTISSFSNDSGTVGDNITNDNTLTLTGAAAAGNTVSIYDGATLLGTAVADGAGTWAFTTGALTDATHSFTATASDGLGHISAASSVLAVTVDTTAPGAPTIASFSTDSGTVGDFITNDNTLALSGTAAAGSTVSVYDGATLLGTATGSGAWNFTTGALTDATHSFTTTARDAAGNVSAASTALSVTVDTVAPGAPTISSYSTDSGTVGDGITNDNTLTFTGTAAAGATVSVYDGATLLGSATTNGSGAWTFTSGVLADAAHSFTATAGDTAGNVSAASSALSVTVYTVAPSAPTISSYSTDSGAVGDGITNDNTLTFTGTAAAGATVSVYDGATLLGTATANGSGAWTFTTGTLTDATHSFTTTARDAAGNVSAASTALSVTVDTVAPGAPTISSYSTDSGTAGDGITNDNTLTFTGTAAAGATVSVYDGATLLGSATTNGSGAWTFTSGVLADAAHSFTATASDTAGNVSGASSALSITVDTVAPSAPAISSYSTDSGTAGDGITNDNTLTFTGTAAASATVSVYDGATLLGTATANGAGAWTFTSGVLADAAHSFTATASDTAGNVSAASSALSVTVDIVAPSAPAISSYSTDSGTVGDGITNDNTLTFTGTAAAGTTLSLYDGATLLGTATANGSGAWTFTSGVLADAAHSFTATARDVAGNVSAASAALNVTIDTAAPSTPTISSYSTDSGAAGDGITNDNTLTFTGTAAAGTTLSLYDGATLLGAATANGSGAWTFTTGTLTDATHSFTATASDVAGNVSAASSALSVIIDTVAPSAPVISSYSSDSGTVGDGITNDNTLTLTGTAAAGSSVSIYDGATLLGGATANGSGAWTFTTGALADATHSLTARASDTAGNTSAASTALNVTIDTAAPGAPTIASFSTDSGSVGDHITNDNTLTLTGTAAAGSTVGVYDGAALLGTSIANGAGAWSFTTGTLSDATHSLTATAADSAANASVASAALTVTIDTAAPAAPTIALFSTDSGTVGDSITNDNTLTLTGAAAAGSTVSLYDGATLLGSATANGTGAWSYTTGTLADAIHTLTARASDAAGNASAASAALNVTIDTAAPAAPTILASSVNSFGVSGASLTLTGMAEAGSIVSLYGMGLVKGGGVTLLGTVTAALDGAWSFATSSLSGTGLRFTATASDAAGNVSASSALFHVMVIDSSPTGGSADAGGDFVSADQSLSFVSDTGWSEIGKTEPAIDGLVVNHDEFHQASLVPNSAFLLV